MIETRVLQQSVVSSASASTGDPDQPSTFGAAHTASMSRYTLALQALLDFPLSRSASTPMARRSTLTG